MTGTVEAFQSRLQARTFRLLSDLQRDLTCKRIRDAREEAGMTQSEAAAALKITERSYRYYESGRVPSVKRLREIAALFRVSYEALAVGEEQPAPEPGLVDAISEIRGEIARLRRDLGLDE